MRRDPLYTERARDLRQNANAAEQRLWAVLRGKRIGGFKFRRQHALGQYIADFICLQARLVIEVDGDRHGNDEREALDTKRTEYIERLGYRVIRFWNNEVLTATDGVVAAIANELGVGDAAAARTCQLPPLSPTLSPCGEREHEAPPSARSGDSF
jgi:very-short-patch-repair endonuclease